MTIVVFHYLQMEQWAKVSTRLVDCKRQVVENWPEGYVMNVAALPDPVGRARLMSEISAVCSAAPFAESRPVGQ